MTTSASTRTDSVPTGDPSNRSIQATPADFAAAPAARPGQRVALERFLDVQVEVTVEVGRASATLGELMNLGVGAVIELDREISQPVDVIAQGARIGRGEIIVVDDRFAVRITQINPGPSPSSSSSPTYTRAHA